MELLNNFFEEYNRLIEVWNLKHANEMALPILIKKDYDSNGVFLNDLLFSHALPEYPLINSFVLESSPTYRADTVCFAYNMYLDMFYVFNTTTGCVNLFDTEGNLTYSCANSLESLVLCLIDILKVEQTRIVQPEKVINLYLETIFKKNIKTLGGEKHEFFLSQILHFDL